MKTKLISHAPKLLSLVLVAGLFAGCAATRPISDVALGAGGASRAITPVRSTIRSFGSWSCAGLPGLVESNAAEFEKLVPSGAAAR